MTCTAFGNPRPSVRWLREGSLMVSSAKYKVHLNLLSVTLRNLFADLLYLHVATSCGLSYNLTSVNKMIL